ncbi:conserved hypothetical protein [Rubrobacter radiotolerans DSM 5868]|nr:conserved hypothetical protein [Rubrobacter radiotolerans DSM 5868]
MQMRVLVSFNRHHYAYGDAIARAIGCCRPHLEVSVAGSEGLDAAVSRVRPDVVISDRPKSAFAASAAWVEVPPRPDVVARICVGGRSRTSRNPSLSEMLSVVDEAESISA